MEKEKIYVYALIAVLFVLVGVIVVAITPTVFHKSGNNLIEGDLTVTGRIYNNNNTLANLADVQLLGLKNGQILIWNSTSGKWVNSLQDSNALANLDDVAFGILSNGNIPIYDSGTGKWTNQQPFTSGWNATVNQLINNASISCSQITIASTTVNQLIQTYLASTNLGNLKATNYASTEPMGAYSYMIYVDPTTSNLYVAKAANGTIMWSATNASYVINQCTQIPFSFVQIQNGLYVENGSILVADGVTVSGQGWNTIIKVGDNSSPVSLNGNAFNNVNFGKGIHTANYNITIQNLAIDGNNINQVLAGNTQKGIEFVNVTNGLVQHVYCHNTVLDGLGAWQGSNNCVFQYNTVFNNTDKHGIFIEAYGIINPTYVSFNNQILFNHINGTVFGIAGGTGCYNTQIIGNYISNTTNVAINMQGGQGITYGTQVYQNIISNCPTGIATNGAVSLQISSNAISRTTNYGISLINTTQSKIIENLISYSTNIPYQSAISLTTCSNNQINGNNIFDAGIADNTGNIVIAYGISLGTGSSDNSLSQNTISADNSNSSKTAIYITASSLRTTALGNIFINSTTGILSLDTTIGEYFENNKGYNNGIYITSPVGGLALWDNGNSTTFPNGQWITNTQSPKTLYIANGNVTNVGINGVYLISDTTLATPLTVMLEPGEQFKITYSVAPTILVVRR